MTFSCFQSCSANCLRPYSIFSGVSTALPRTSSNPVLSSYDFSCFSTLQLTCPSVSEMKSSTSLTLVSIPFRESSYLCDVSLGSLHPLIPLEFHRDLLKLLPSSSHPGSRASRRLLLVWPGLSRDVGFWARACLCCQQSKKQTHVHASVPAIPVPSRRFSHVHLDLVSPLSSSHGFTYFLTMIIRTIRWPEVAPLSSITAESCVRAFLFSWVARLGVPSVLTSDQGSQFTSSIWTRVCCSQGISLLTTSSFPPQNNGMIEGFKDRSRLLSVLAWLAQIGFFTCLWCSLVSILFPKRTLGSLFPRLCLVLLLPLLESS